MNTFQKTSIRATLIAATLAAMPFSANAAGLGRISVLSALGQPLRAEIELTATADELSSMTAAVAAPTAFKDAGIAFAPALKGIQMSVERRGKRSVLKLTSARPINDPFVDVLVELNWSAGRLLREYTFLLDPPDMPAPAAAAGVGAAISKPVARAASPIGGAPGDYRVKRGDTLGKIARQYKPAGVSMDQMLIALYQANPEAFVDNNINRLRAGVILNVPDANAANAVSAGEARQQVIAHAADFNAYRRRVADRAAASAPVEPTESTQASAGKITAKVEETPTPVSESKDQVKVSQTAEPSAGASSEIGEANERLKSLEEDIVARDRALKEANDRLAALEQNISELQQLIEMKNESLAALQQQAQGGDTTAAPDTPAEPVTAAPMPEAATQTPAEAPAGAQPAEAPMAEAPTPSGETAAGGEPSMPAGAQDALEKELQDLVKPQEEAAPPVAAEPAPEPAPAVEQAPMPKPVPPAPAPKPEPGIVDSLMSNPLAIGGLLAALAAALGLVALRRKKAAGKGDTPNETAMASVFPPDQNSVFGETGGQSVDTGSSSLIQTDFSQSGLSAIDTDEGVDPVAEADVYMAYGRDAQAEEILLDAMKADPSRTAIHLKLLEIYSQRKNLQQFETTAAELYTVTGGKGEAWDKAVEMGTKLDPDNPLFKREPAPDSAAAPDAGVSEGFTAPQTSATAAAAAAGAALTGMAVAAAEEKPAEAPEEDIDASLDFSGAIPTPDEPSPSQMKDTWAIPGELNQFTDSDADHLMDQVESAQAGQAADEEDLSLDTGDLDFNLDLDETDTEGEAIEAVAKAEDAPVEDGVEFDSSFDAADSSLEFNLDLSEPPPGNENMAETSVSGVLPDINLESTDLSGGAAEMDSGEGGIEVDLEATDLGTSSGIDFESALNAGTDVPEGNNNGDVAVVDLEKTNFEGSLLDFDFDLDEDKSSENEENMMATSLDLSDINLDLEGADAEAPAAPELDAPADVSAETGQPDDADSFDLPDLTETQDQVASFEEGSPQLEQPGDDAMMASLTKSVVTSLTDSRAVPDLPADEELNQEVDTKLELARAYEEMGDAEGARELLDEVMRDGDDAQQEQAKSILARLG